MQTPLLRLSAALLLVACGPEGIAASPARGRLEWEQVSVQAFRDGARVEFVVVGEVRAGVELDRVPACGLLTDEALQDVRATVAALDLTVDYSLADGECQVADAPQGIVHVQGAVEGPFGCDHWCCREELKPIALVYFHAFLNLHGTVIEQDGEPREVLDPTRACQVQD